MTVATAAGAARATAEIHDLLARYFDALHRSDADLLGEVLHPAASYVTVDGGELVHRTMAEYLPIVAARESPASRAEVRTDAVDAIELAGPDVALARVRCSVGERHFTDLLSLVRVGERWWVIAKVFATRLAPPAAEGSTCRT